MSVLHVCALAHTQTDGRFWHCAYTSKTERFCRMMTAAGHEVILYSGDLNTVAVCSEHVPVFTEGERLKWFGPGIDDGDFSRVRFDANEPGWRQVNLRTAAQVLGRAKPGDVLCLIGGDAQKPIADLVPEILPLEWGVGYTGIFAPYCVFESAAWRHYVYGWKGGWDGRWYDTVIHNFFDPADFVVAGPSPDAVWESIPGVPDGGEYLLFVGRVTLRKGPHVAAQIAERLGLPLVVAGFGATLDADGRVVPDAGEALPGQVTYLGPVAPPMRAQLMTGAVALLAPTLYVEPFGGAAVEANLCGTPAITSDFGAFTETIVPGVNGYRFSTLAEGCEAVDLTRRLERGVIREYAAARFSLAAIEPQYTAYLERLVGLYGKGWDA